MDEELLSILACPACIGSLAQETNYLVCQNLNCGLRFPIRDGIPVLLVEEAEKPR